MAFALFDLILNSKIKIRLIGGGGLFGVEPKINISEHYNDLDLFIVSINVGTNTIYIMTNKL